MTRELQRLACAIIALAWVWNVAPAAERKGPLEKPWSFKALTKPALPAVKDSTWVRDDLDRFILAAQESHGLKANGDADRATLIRRVAFDLTGLPPTEREVAAFLNDRSKDDIALAKVIDAYLASPAFGERWARHWLDVVRYADSVGRTWNAPFTYAFRYRDYVIDAFNQDKPYDRFITEQIAGDLLPAKTVAERRANLTATGLLALGSHDLQALSQEQFFMDVVDDQIDVVSRSMLGLTISCARCHDHKYDPVTMRDYYALAGIFYSTKILPGASYRGQGNGYLDHEQLWVLPVSQGGKAITPSITPGVHSMSDYQEQWSRGGKRDIRFSTDPNLAMGVREDEEIVDCELRIKGDPHDRGPAPPRGDLKIVGLPPMAKPAKSSSGRLELAKWIASPKHPLTARVMTNRVWQHLFGQGLVTTADDFGMSSESPYHPELLDHLSIRFAEDWSIKQLIRSIMLSHTYRLGGQTKGNVAQDTDPQNSWYWRANLRRLEFEPLRDSLLAVAGRLSSERPEGVQVAGIGGKSSKSQVHGLIDIEDDYRTIYLPVVRSRVSESYNTFDFPDPCQISGRRDVTTVAPQALFFMNSRFVSDCAGETAALALAAASNDGERVQWLYRRLFGRVATVGERDDGLKLLNDLSGASPADRGEAWTTLVQALMCSAEFRYVR